MSTIPPQASENSHPTASEGLSRIGKGVGDLFSKKAMWGALLGAIVGFLLSEMLGLPPLETVGILALGGAVSASGAAGDVFGGVKEFLGSFFGGKSSNQQQVAQSQQPDQPGSPGENVTPGFGYAPGYGQNTGRTR